MTDGFIDDVTGAILVGGQSRRMGRDKALLTVAGAPLIERVVHCFQLLFEHIILVGDRPERFVSLGLPVLPDLYPGSALGGIHAALHHAQTDLVFVSPCDTPFPSPAIARHLSSLAPGHDVVVPRSERGLEPLFAIYRRSCIGPVEELLSGGTYRIFDFFHLVRTRVVEAAEFRHLDPEGRAFLNVNTPAELAAAEETERP